MAVAGERAWAGVAGVLAGGVAIGGAELVAALVRPESSPVLAVGGVAVDAAPRQVKDFAIRTFGSGDKAALLTGIGVVLALCAFAIGVRARRRLRDGLLGVGAFGVVGIAAVLSRPAPAVLDVLPTLLGTAAGCLALQRLIALLPAPAPAEASTGAPAEAPAAAAPARSQVTAPAAPAGASRDAAPAGTSHSSSATARAATAGTRAARGGTAGRPATAGAGSGGRRRPAGAGPDGGVSWDRRRFLAVGSATAVGAVVAGVGGRALSDTRFSAQGSRAAVKLPAPVSPAPPLPSTVDTGVSGASRFLTANRAFYRVDTALVPPQVPAETWSLKIHGMVRREVSLSYSDLLSRPMIERVITLTCVSNEVGGPYIGTARWLGVPLRDVLDQAGIDPAADQLVCTSRDGMTIGAPARTVLDGRDALLAVGMNGEPLPIEHGFPVRMVVPGLYGYCSACKWLVDIEATVFGRYDAYWVQRGWAQVAEIRTESRIDTPRDSATVKAGPTAVGGVAWAQHRGISAVEVSVDGGAWQPAQLADQPSRDAWRLWSYRWDASPGRHTLAVRATDGTGAVQTDALADPFPSGATGYHSVNVTVR